MPRRVTARALATSSPALRRGEMVYAELRQAILRGALRAGDRLREEELAERLHVSRTPVREAIGRLEAEGLAVALPRRGLAVAEVSPEHVMEIYFVREVLEGAASRLAARHVTRLQATQLEELLEAMSEAAARDDTAATEALNRRFHSLIYAAARNRLIQQILDGLWDDLRRFGVTTFTYPGRKQEALAEHRAIVDAIVGGREAEAERLARAHLVAGREVRLRLIHGGGTTPQGEVVPAAPRGDDEAEGVTTRGGRAIPRAGSGGVGNGNRAVRPATAGRGTTGQRRR